MVREWSTVDWMPSRCSKRCHCLPPRCRPPTERQNHCWPQWDCLPPGEKHWRRPEDHHRRSPWLKWRPRPPLHPQCPSLLRHATPATRWTRYRQQMATRRPYPSRMRQFHLRGYRAPSGRSSLRPRRAPFCPTRLLMEKRGKMKSTKQVRNFR